MHQHNHLGFQNPQLFAPAMQHCKTNTEIKERNKEYAQNHMTDFKIHHIFVTFTVYRQE